jgi:hypothetical protein
MLFPEGKGQHMTEVAFVKSLEHVQEVWKEETATKTQWKEKCMGTKAEKQLLSHGGRR